MEEDEEEKNKKKEEMKSKGINVQDEQGGSYFDDVKKEDDVLF